MIKNTLQKYWPLYALTIVITLLLRYFSKTTDSDVIIWMLAPTARWVGILSGITFEYLPHKGYVSNFYRFLVAPSCAGIRFMMILFIMLIFSFLHRIAPKKNGYLWFVFCLAFSYTATVFVNGVRIIVSIYLPPFLERPETTGRFLTPDRLHTLIGTGVYFSSLCILYLLASFVCKRWFAASAKDNASDEKNAPASPRGLFVPAFWYLLIVLIMPFCKRILTNEWEGFGEYTLLIFFTCFAVSTLLYAARPRRRT